MVKRKKIPPTKQQEQFKEALVLSHQMWAAVLPSMIEDIDRIKEGGFNGTHRDSEIIRMVFNIVSGEVRLQQIKEHMRKESG
jgi:hypothetical protein